MHCFFRREDRASRGTLRLLDHRLEDEEGMTIDVRVTRVRAVIAYGVALGAVGCRQLLDDFHVVPSDADGSARCDGPGYPSPAPRGTPAGSIDFTIAMRTLDWGDRIESGIPTYQRVGFNLDEQCTTSRSTSSCLLPAGAAIPQFLDGPEGIDNSIGQFAWQSQGANVTTEWVQAAESSGLAATLLRVRGYNGEDDDDRVEAALFMGTRQPSGGAPPTQPAPAWDGHDTWSITKVFLEDGATLDLPKFVDSNAYVRGGTLVARFPTALQGGPFNAFSIMHGFVLTGTIVARQGSYVLESGLRGGRWAVGSVMSFIGSKLSGSPCRVPSDSPLHALYEQGRLAACTFADVRGEGDDPSMPCDALSFGVRFDGVPAQIGSVLPNDPDPACAEDGCSSLDAGAASGDATTPAP